MLPLIAREAGSRKTAVRSKCSIGTASTHSPRNETRQLRIPVGPTPFTSSYENNQPSYVDPVLVGGVILAENVELKVADGRDSVIWYPYGRPRGRVTRPEAETELENLCEAQSSSDRFMGCASTLRTPLEDFCGDPVWRTHPTLIFIPTFQYSLENISIGNSSFQKV